MKLSLTRQKRVSVIVANNMKYKTPEGKLGKQVEVARSKNELEILKRQKQEEIDRLKLAYTALPKLEAELLDIEEDLTECGKLGIESVVRAEAVSIEK